MAKSNVFTFVSLRPVTYSRPEPDPEIFTAIVATIFDPQDTHPRDPVPVPMVVDPAEERRFLAAVATVPAAERRAALSKRAEALIRSDEYVLRDPGWRALRAAETGLARVIERAGPQLPLDPEAPWAEGVERILAAAVPDARPLSTWIAGAEVRAHRAALWQSLYAASARPDLAGDGRARIMFWLRLFAVLDRVFTSPSPSGVIDWGAIRIGVPATLPPVRTNPRSERPLPDPTAEAENRRARVSTLVEEIADLEEVVAAVEALDAARPASVTVKRSRPDAWASQYRARPSASTVPPADGPPEIEPGPALIIRAGDLSPDHARRLEAAGIRFLGRDPDEVVEEIEEAIGQFEAERDALLTRTVISTRGGVFIRRRVPAD